MSAVSENMKKCSSCLEDLPVEEFFYHKTNTDGKSGFCKKCASSKSNTYQRTKSGLVTRIYASQRRRSRIRGHEPPLYSVQELRDWLLSSNLYHKLHEEWVASNYDMNMVPSIDRIDDNLGYSFDNIRITTWMSNNKKQHTKRCVAVFQYSLDANLINAFPSQSTASKETGICAVSIRNCVIGKQKTAGGFIWVDEFTNEKKIGEISASLNKKEAFSFKDLAHIFKTSGIHGLKNELSKL